MGTAYVYRVKMLAEVPLVIAMLFYMIKKMKRDLFLSVILEKSKGYLKSLIVSYQNLVS
jgi:hypothetical protein